MFSELNRSPSSWTFSAHDPLLFWPFSIFLFYDPLHCVLAMYIIIILIMINPSQESLVSHEEAVLQLRRQQEITGCHWEGSLLHNLGWWRARHEGRGPSRKLGPLRKVPAPWEMLWSVRRKENGWVLSKNGGPWDPTKRNVLLTKLFLSFESLKNMPGKHNGLQGKGQRYKMHFCITEHVTFSLSTAVSYSLQIH